MKAGDSIRIVQLSDLHHSTDVPDSLIEQSFEIALAQKPDIICFTGDYITEGRGYDEAWYRDALRRLSGRVRCFATLGNHDGGAWAGRPGQRYTTERVTNLLESAGIPVLTNRYVDVPVRGNRVRLVGVGDLWAKQCNPWIAFKSVPKDDVPTVVMSHNPDSKVMMEEFRWELMLSGHTHGGQIVMPILGLSPAPVSDKRYVRGMKPWNGRMINVSAGVGNIRGIRFNCRPEVNAIELYTA
jgi:predicted MPP superfamily phosphohydrolase